ncbi:MAG: radical SAM protein [Sedimentisphaerales bacterium]|nr:radical SAM protein [Sedimentisphaerales bacterium]
MGTHSQVGCHRVSPGNEFFAEHGYLEVPSLVQWMATLRCGLSCEHCLAVSHESGFSDMPIERVRGLVDEVARMGVREFLVTGGEPLGREDLAEVIEYLGGKGVNWSLNTAAMPGRNLREAMTRNKPGFVAVSLDGPRQVHDGFRGKVGAYEEALESIRFFKSLGVKVCAGTTVTSRNYDYLDETFHLVLAGGADQWGIHLLVPEGRAAGRKDLFLSKGQLKRLVKFVAHKRRYFDVQMADEIGYLGYLEPLVRDLPLSCGAGRAQCVVLPDGSVVPCTTLDRSCSAGNMHGRPLAQIWAEGFQDLRSWRPEGKCDHCAYSPACRGGCWLQRKSGTQCFKDVWHVPEALKTAAGIAICLGSLAGYEGSRAAGQAVGAIPVAQALGALAGAAATSPYLMDETILTFYINQAAGGLTNLPAGADLSDPAWKFFKDFTTGTLPEDITERCTVVHDALNTQERSLSLIALLWRAVSGPLFAVDSTKEYSQAERQTIRDTLAALQLKADEWRLEIFMKQLDPYLSNGRRMPSTARMKSLSATVYIARSPVLDDLSAERWGAPANPETWDAATAYLVAHHYADQMDLVLRSNNGQITKYTGGKAGALSYYPSAPTIGVFDVIATTGDVKLYFDVKGSLKVVPAYETAQGSMLPDQAGEQDLTATVQVTLPGGKEYTYVELLNEIYRQQKDAVLSMAYGWLSRTTIPLWNQDVPVVAAVYQNGTLLWPALREILESIPPTVPPTRSDRALLTSAGDTITPDVQQRAVLKDIDFWMF